MAAGGRAELGKIVDALLCSRRLKKVVKTSMPLSSTRFLIFSACVSKLFSLIVLNRMLSWVTTRLVSCPKPPALLGPVEETGEAVEESETEGECLTSRGPLAPPPEILPPGCDAEERLAMDEERRGLLPEVTVRALFPL